ncbi:MAG: Stk1 family PASTA domain-containing Ser/Thr kinase [Ornithinibacter sp.]
MSPTGDALIGRTLDGRYRVLERIAEGGMAPVYLALDERLEREVALKVMRQHLVHDESFVTRFRREARAAASLSHPNVVGVYDQGRDGDHIFLAMEMVPGQTLREVLQAEGPLSPRAALDILEPVLMALAEAHHEGLIHRDVKPENVIIKDNGTVKVADFGLARAVSSQTMTSSSGVLLGTVAYLSPEQVERGVADARSDVYAAGLMLFEMLTGTKAFTGETAIHVAYQHVHGGVPAPSTRVEGLPPALDTLVATATARDPDDRPADAGDFLDLLRQCRAALPVAALDARPEGEAAAMAATLPTATTALPVGAAVAPRDGDTRSLAVSPPLRGVVLDAPPRRRNWWPAVLMSALVAAITAWFFILGPGATSTIPALQGQPREQAVSELRAVDLEAVVSEVFDENAPKGEIMSLAPAAGTNVRRGTEVSLVVSKGPERYAVPSVVGTTLAEAKLRIAEASLAVGPVTTSFSEKVPDGQLISTKPKQGGELKKGSAVAMTVSKGRKPITVPNVIGQASQAAAKQLTALGLGVDATAQANSDTVAKGNVISQSPGEGTLFKGDKVTLVISKGPVLVDVPNVVGQQVDQARTSLEGLGFTVEVRKALGGFFGTVRLQDPAGGQAPKGSTITLTIV